MQSPRRVLMLGWKTCCAYFLDGIFKVLFCSRENHIHLNVVTVQKNISDLSLLNFKAVNLFCSTFYFLPSVWDSFRIFTVTSTSFGTSSSGSGGWLSYCIIFFSLVIFKNAKSQTNVVVSCLKTRKYIKTNHITSVRTRVLSNAMKSQPYIVIPSNRQPQIGTGTLFHNQDIRRGCVKLKSL